PRTEARGENHPLFNSLLVFTPALSHSPPRLPTGISLKIAQRLSAGILASRNLSPAGTKESLRQLTASFVRAGLRLWPTTPNPIPKGRAIVGRLRETCIHRSEPEFSALKLCCS